MRTALLFLVLAAAAGAQPTDADLPNPAKIGDRKDFPAEGVSFQPPEGCVTVAADGPEGQRTISASRVVRVDGRDEPMGIQVEIIGDLDLKTYRRILEGLQLARGVALVTVDEAVRDGRPSWRAELPGKRGEPLTHIIALDAGDRLVVVTWAPRDAVARELSGLLEDSVRSVKVEPREPPAPSLELTETWSPQNSGASLSHPAGWKTTDLGEARALRNPRDRFENLALGLMDGSASRKRAEWEALRRDPVAGKSCLEGREEKFLGRDSFVCRSRLVHQGVGVINETRLVEHHGRLVFVSMTSREDLWDDHRKLLDAVLATLKLEE